MFVYVFYLQINVFIIYGIRTLGLYLPYSYWGRTIYILCGGVGVHAHGRVSSLTRERSFVWKCLAVANTDRKSS